MSDEIRPFKPGASRRAEREGRSVWVAAACLESNAPASTALWALWGIPFLFLDSPVRVAASWDTHPPLRLHLRIPLPFWRSYLSDIAIAIAIAIDEDGPTADQFFSSLSFLVCLFFSRFLSSHRQPSASDSGPFRASHRQPSASDSGPFRASHRQSKRSWFATHFACKYTLLYSFCTQKLYKGSDGFI